MSENKREYAGAIRSAVKAAVLQANHANVHIPTPGQRGAVIGIINKIAGGDDNRKLLLGWLFANEDELFDRVSTKTLDDYQWAALYAWCDFEKDEERVVWRPKPSFTQECLACLSAAMDDYFELKYVEQEELPVPEELIAKMADLGGEITYTGVNAGIKAPDEVFEHEKDLPIPETPSSPYVTARPAIRQVFQTKPKLYNPFD